MLEQTTLSHSSSTMLMAFCHGKRGYEPQVCVSLRLYLCLCSTILGITVPIIPGVMPIRSCASFQRVKDLTGLKVPPSLHQALQERCVRNPGLQRSQIASDACIIARQAVGRRLRGRVCHRHGPTTAF
jgi:5,10-methylenetetrahydrofolate reductase